MKIDMKGKIIPALKEGNLSLSKNVKFADKFMKNIAKPEEISKNFADSAKFAAEMHNLFPKE